MPGRKDLAGVRCGVGPAYGTHPFMEFYLPIANLAVNGLVIVGLGVLTGLLSGLFGVGGGFLTTPLLIFYGIPPTVAAASAASTVTGASVSGVIAHGKRGNVDYRMGWVLVAGGAMGSGLGALVFRLLQQTGQIDTAINLLYVLLLGSIGGLMAKESLQTLYAARKGRPVAAAKRRHHPLVAVLPLRWRFYRSGLYISPLAPLLLGLVTGMLTMLMGVGGGSIMVPAMLYILGMNAQVVVGTSLFQILFVTMVTTMMHALTTHAIDLVLAALLLLGSVIGAQLGARLTTKASPAMLRLVLAVIVLAVGLRMAVMLTWAPQDIFTVSDL